MIDYIKSHKWKLFILAILYIVVISSIITGPKEIKIIFSIILIIMLTIRTLIIIKFFKNKKNEEELEEFSDWEMAKYGFHATSKKEIIKRLEEFYKENENENK